MIEALRVTETEEQLAAVIHLRISRDRMQAEMPVAIQEVQAALAAQGLEAVGPLFAHHLATFSDALDFEVGFPVSSPISPTGRVRAGALPGARVLRSVYRGPYEGLFAAWGEFNKRAEGMIAEHGLTTGSTLWERYVSGPETDPDPSAWCTELNVPLLDPGSQNGKTE